MTVQYGKNRHKVRVCAESPDTYLSSWGLIVLCVQGTDMYSPRKNNKLSSASYSVSKPAKADTALAATCRAAFAIFVEWRAQQEFAAMKRQVLELRNELALFGDSVGCIKNCCSVCHENPSECNCKTWTCRCAACIQMRHVYRATLSSTACPFFRMIGDRPPSSVPCQHEPTGAVGSRG